MNRKNLRVLVARIDRIGDVVLSTPIPREIKKAFPESFVSVLVRNYTKDVFINNQNVDETIVYDQDYDGSKKSFWKLVNEIRKFKFTHAFMLLPNERLNWILLLSGIPNRIGVGHKLYQFLSFSKFVDRQKYIPLRHEADYCLDMVRKIGIEPTSNIPEIFLSEDEIIKRDVIKRKLAPNNEMIIGINTTSGKSSPNIQVSEYVKLINKFSGRKEFKILVTDNNPPDELKKVEDIIFPNIDSSLRNSIINFSALDVLISSSTGPMHICAALKVPTISMFCPLPACSPKLWGPLGNKTEIILPEENYCSTKCPGDPHICDFSGEGGINADIIYERITSFIKRK